MPIAFSRSLRSLHADGRSRRAIWFLLIPAVVLAAWTAWFLGAQVARYEVSNDAYLDVQAPAARRVIAKFASPGRIRVGQRAHLRLPGSGNIPLHVTSVSGAQVELAVDPATVYRCETDCRGTVEVEIEKVSPATLLLRAAGYGPPQ